MRRSAADAWKHTTNATSSLRSRRHRGGQSVTISTWAEPHTIFKSALSRAREKKRDWRAILDGRKYPTGVHRVFRCLSSCRSRVSEVPRKFDPRV